MRFTMRRKYRIAVLMLGLGMFLCTGDRALAQSSSQSGQSSSSASSPNTPADPYQRSGDVFYMRRMGESGWQRGQEIWYMKCWICHNDYTRQANDPNKSTVAPTLKDLYKRPMLMSGQPVNDETVTAKIKEGGPGMPGYKYGLTDKDLADLVEYLREKCCWDEQNPPPNPRFRSP